MQFQSANPSVVRSIRQRDLLNTWLRAVVKPRPLPVLADYRPECLADELPDMMGFDVEGCGDDARFLITQEGATLQDPDGKDAQYERLLLPLGSAGGVEQIGGSDKAISIEGHFKIRNLMGMRPRAIPVIIERASSTRTYYAAPHTRARRKTSSSTASAFAPRPLA